MSLTLFGAPAQADPEQPTTVAEAKALVDELNMEAAAIDQEYAAATDKLATAKKRLKQHETDLAAQEQKVKRMRSKVAAFALATYQRRGAHSTAAFITSDDSAVLNRIATIEQVSANQVQVLRTFQAEQADLDDLKSAAETERVSQATAIKEMASAKERSEAKVNEAKQVLARLTAEERARIAEQEAQERAEAARNAAAAQQQQRETAADQTTRSEDRSDDSDDSDDSEASDSEQPAAPPASGRAGTAVAFAKSQVGKSYVMGATGPNSYDCSGLTGAAWRAAGVSLPRTSQQQFGAGTPVSTSALQPGDLVFYYSGISHVGIYVGGGTIVHAANPRTGVAYAGLHSMPLMGARRVG